MEDLRQDIADFVNERKAVDEKQSELYQRVNISVKESVQLFLHEQFPRYSIHSTSVSYCEMEKGLNVFIVTLLDGDRIPENQMPFFYKNIQNNPKIDEIKDSYGLAKIILVEEIYQMG